MVKKSKKSPLPNLVVPKEEAHQKILKRIPIGKDILSKKIKSMDDLDEVTKEKSKWSEYNLELLSRLFDNSAIADGYNQWSGFITNINPSFHELVTDFKKSMGSKITHLESILNRLELIPEAISSPSLKTINNKETSNKVFLVHGHDDAARETVARFLEKFDLEVIILRDEPDKGRTIIEKIEDYSDVGFAVVLLTPDDKGTSISKEEYNSRARQNVIFEWGYFIGKLGRDRVSALYKEGIEMPSDYSGVLYIQFDDNDGWQMRLAREIGEAGLDIDLNKIFS